MEEKTEKLNRFDKCKIALEKGITCNPETGLIFGVRGKEIKSTNGKGYIDINFKYNKKRYHLLAHTFIYYCTNGEYDINLDIDHIDGNTSNNKILNLRLVTHGENMQNQPKAKGYCWDEKRKSFQVYIKINKKRIHLGYYKLEEDAIKAREAGKLKYHTH